MGVQLFFEHIRLQFKNIGWFVKFCPGQDLDSGHPIKAVNHNGFNVKERALKNRIMHVNATKTHCTDKKRKKNFSPKGFAAKKSFRFPGLFSRHLVSVWGIFFSRQWCSPLL